MCKINEVSGMVVNVNKAGPRVSFRGKREIFRNLGSAIQTAQNSFGFENGSYLEATKILKAGCDGSTYAFIDATVRDSYFLRFMKNIIINLKKPAGICSTGSLPGMTLSQIARLEKFDMNAFWKTLNTKVMEVMAEGLATKKLAPGDVVKDSDLHILGGALGLEKQHMRMGIVDELD